MVLFKLGKEDVNNLCKIEERNAIHRFLKSIPK